MPPNKLKNTPTGRGFKVLNINRLKQERDQISCELIKILKMLTTCNMTYLLRQRISGDYIIILFVYLLAARGSVVG